MVVDDGLRIILENPNQPTKIFVAVYDLDVEAAYPNGEDILNASKTTTVAELSAIRGVDESVTRPIGLNIMAGRVNAVEIVTSVCKAPTLEDFFKDYEENELNVVD